MRLALYILLFLIFNNLLAQHNTINYVDNKQFKQGHWIIYFENTNTILEKGTYRNNQREGIWTQYQKTGIINSEITYTNNIPNGYAKIYYPNGKLLEEGIWKNGFWIGQYKAYYKNGKLNYKWNFSDNGLRTGKQEYYYENGKKMIEGNWEEGLENGIIKLYNQKEELIQKQTFDKGRINPKFTIRYLQNNKLKKTITPKTQNSLKDSIIQEEFDIFETTGNRNLYDIKNRLTQEGYFEKGKLINGKKYYYNNNDSIIRITIYKNGKFKPSSRVE